MSSTAASFPGPPHPECCLLALVASCLPLTGLLFRCGGPMSQDSTSLPRKNSPKCHGSPEPATQVGLRDKLQAAFKHRTWCPGGSKAHLGVGGSSLEWEATVGRGCLILFSADLFFARRREHLPPGLGERRGVGGQLMEKGASSLSACQDFAQELPPPAAAGGIVTGTSTEHASVPFTAENWEELSLSGSNWSHMCLLKGRRRQRECFMSRYGLLGGRFASVSFHPHKTQRNRKRKSSIKDQTNTCMHPSHRCPWSKMPEQKDCPLAVRSILSRKRTLVI
ncbi:UNVERIFIED_CONTAM: hypothetical protein K2H54_020160 [Gekko kuhli]